MTPHPTTPQGTPDPQAELDRAWSDQQLADFCNADRMGKQARLPLMASYRSIRFALQRTLEKAEADRRRLEATDVDKRLLVEAIVDINGWDGLSAIVEAALAASKETP